jgi:putative copper resistance protein D
LLALVTCGAAFAATRSASSHAEARSGAALMVTDWVHMLSTGVWAGVVFVAACVVLRSQPPSSVADSEDCRTYVESLSTTATGALALVLVTGIINAWSGVVASWSSGPLASQWSVILLAKLALVVTAIALGAHNRAFGLPRLRADLQGESLARGRSLQTFSTVISVEAIVLLAVEIAAAALSTSAPPTAT